MAYRNSFFKKEGKGKFFITSVTLKLEKNHRLHLEYGAIRQEMEKSGITSPTIADVGRTVCAIRTSKLPDPKELGNSGSFFKNPEIPAAQYEQLKANTRKSLLPYYSRHGKSTRRMLIEQMGWKGKRVGNTGAHARQSLVLVNYGESTGAEVWALAQQIQASVAERFGIALEPEVNVL